MKRIPDHSEGSQEEQRVLGALRKRIIGGAIRPGSRLPTRRVLARELGVGWSPVQRAFDRLKADGFVRTGRRRGTFVVDRPPHLYQYALIFSSHPNDSYLYSWSRFWTALSNAAELITRTTDRKITIYHDVDGHADSESYQLLLGQIRAHKFAGLIFGVPPYYLVGTPLMELPDLPRVGVMSENRNFPNTKAVSTDTLDLIDRGLQHLAMRSRRRVGFLFVDHMTGASPDEMQAAAAKWGMQSLPQWVQYSSTARAAQQSVLLMMKASAKDRPDALIVADDHLVDGAQRGLIDAGVRVPHDVDVVAMENFPAASQDVLPITRIGVDSRELIWRCVELIDRMRHQSGPVPERTVVPNHFAHEIPAQFDFSIDGRSAVLPAAHAVMPPEREASGAGIFPGASQRR